MAYVPNIDEIVEMTLRNDILGIDQEVEVIEGDGSRELAKIGASLAKYWLHGCKMFFLQKEGDQAKNLRLVRQLLAATSEMLVNEQRQTTLDQFFSPWFSDIVCIISLLVDIILRSYPIYTRDFE